ncbi:MAG: SIMPL domain-containing protein [Lachnospirales bacterium]
MKRKLVGIVLATSLLSQSVLASTTLTFNGTANIEQTVDKAVYNVTVSATGESLEEVKLLCDDTVTDMTAKIIGTSLVDKEDIVVNGFSSYKNYNYDPVTHESKEDGYTGSYVVEISIDDLNNLNTITTVVTGYDLVGYSYTSLTIEDDDELYIQALENATKSAIEKADRMVGLLFPGKTYTVTNFEETSSNYVNGVGLEKNEMLGSADMELNSRFDESSVLPTVDVYGSVEITVEVAE